MEKQLAQTDVTGTVDQELVETKIREAVARALEMEASEVQLTSSFVEELYAESLDLLDVAFAIEREFKVRFPRTDILERATQYFGEEALVTEGGLVTDLGIALLREAMPEVDPGRLQAGMEGMDVARVITVGTFAGITTRLLEAKANFSKECPACGATTVESELLPEYVCPECSEVVPLPSGDEILLQDLVALSERAEFAQLVKNPTHGGHN